MHLRANLAAIRVVDVVTDVRSGMELLAWKYDALTWHELIKDRRIFAVPQTSRWTCISLRGKERRMKRFKRILACTDFSEVGNRAVEMAFGLAHDDDATMVLAHILDQPDVPNPMYAHYVSQATWEPHELDNARLEAEKALRELVPAGAASLGVTVDVRTPHGNSAEEILRLIEECETEVVVMGTHGRTGLERFLLGSVTERVVRTAGCAVMVVH